MDLRNFQFLSCRCKASKKKKKKMLPKKCMHVMPKELSDSSTGIQWKRLKPTIHPPIGACVLSARIGLLMVAKWHRRTWISFVMHARYYHRIYYSHGWLSLKDRWSSNNVIMYDRAHARELLHLMVVYLLMAAIQECTAFCIAQAAPQKILVDIAQQPLLPDGNR